MPVEVRHPTRPGVFARCGYNGLDGSFQIEVWAPVDGGHEVMHHGSGTTGSPVPLREILDVMVRNEFFGWHDIYLADQALKMLVPNEIDDPDVRRTAELLEALKAEAGR